jgi:formylmethanofuran dehydrogenase subunit D
MSFKRQTNGTGMSLFKGWKKLISFHSQKKKILEIATLENALSSVATSN